jgi:beta-xylosidase
VDDSSGKPTYFLTHTIDNGADFPLYTSHDLVTWTLQPQGLFNHTGTPGSSVQMGDYFYCWLWAPEIRPAVGIGGYILSFTASRFASMQHSCPGYDEGSGTFMAYSKSPYGPFYDASNADVFPRPTGPSLEQKECPTNQWLGIPHSTVVDQHDCGSKQGILCNNTMRLDPGQHHENRRQTLFLVLIASARWLLIY